MSWLGRRERMYIIIKETGKSKIPLKCYKSLDNACAFLKQYVKESSFDYSYVHFGGKGKTDIRYYRSLKNNIREYIYVKYMKLYD